MPLFQMARARRGRLRVFMRAQLPFIIGTLLVFTGLAIAVPDALSAPLVVIAALLILTASIAAVFIPWERFSPTWLIVVAVVDIVAVALLRTELRALLPAVTMLAIFPILWIAYAFPPVAFIAAVGGAALMTSLPFLVRGSWPETALDWVNVVTLPGLILAIAVIVNLAAQHLRRNAARLRAAHDARARALARAHDNELVLRTVLDTVRSGVVLYDGRGRLLLANRTAEELSQAMGFSLDEPPYAGDAVLAADRMTPVPPHDQLIPRALRGDRISNAVEWVGPPAMQRAIIADADSVRRADGTLLGTLVAAYDVTEMADAAQIRQDFLRTVSHELRTPLTSVTGYLDLLTEHVGGADPAAARYLSMIERNVLVLRDRMNELLAAASSESPISPRDVVLSDIIGSAVRAVTPRAERRGSSIQQIGTTADRVVLDPVRIRQTLEELLVNAVKFSPPSSAVVVGQRIDDSGIHIAVSDSGPGLTAAERSRIFDPFYRTDFARENAIQGFGIGLSVVRNAVVAHGGKIRVGASAAGGTAMTVSLPLRLPGDLSEPAAGQADAVG
ncbi:PAS domain-containing sensor histidine kinase [Microbacterium sp. NM3R9]|uniref:sensor histidine kinase n=1 Tax=Microbacterium thalli TaxID=3027921 RepID=UPI002366FE3A|nr:PAS domain-containing sensor histidine kinase [Microbacterium thalli]MDD7930734.1 PAS domain-containing sensor histidine kinase [Microbacterium thalli]MDN8548972.1 PAS domain-containing sensor histidine kinase [Microbacterium thalli]